MQGTIEQLPMASRPGSILLDGVGRAWFRPSDVLGGTPQLGARVSVKGVRRSQQSLVAEEVYLLPPPPGPLEDGNDVREVGYLTIRDDVGQALVSLVRRLAPGKGGCAAEVERACRAFLAKLDLEVPPPAEEIRPEQREEMIRHFAPVLVTHADQLVVLEWNAPARCFRINAIAPRLGMLVEALAASLRDTCFEGWRQMDTER